MLHLVDGRVHADSAWFAGKRFVETCFLDIGAEAINGLQTGCRIDRKQIWSEPHVCTILYVCTMEGQMSATFPCIICEPDIGDFGQERAGVLGKWVKCQAVDDYCKDLCSVSFGV